MHHSKYFIVLITCLMMRRDVICNKKSQQQQQRQRADGTNVINNNTAEVNKHESLKKNQQQPVCTVRVGACAKETLKLMAFHKLQGGLDIPTFKVISEQLRMSTFFSMRNSSHEFIIYIWSDTNDKNIKVDDFIKINDRRQALCKLLKTEHLNKANKYFFLFLFMGGIHAWVHLRSQ
ncbi:hypothetical protein HELRODRAFT_170794 [Helobdella robusta]|uniref:Uncharacterized protein n=1 Tax=Helobdella robusta TaxID=6412 RepID=T1F3F7_HELRO|nr:hypothetical protein HELRODRAFT_170794 [Helobdella robusta]ESO06778.1 hypothetical protein HELRODRAFT_170794 [Helobdella robusta]